LLEATPYEEKIRVIKIARQLQADMLSQYADDIKKFCSNIDAVTGKRRSKPEPVESPEDAAKLEAVLAEARARR
jgi:hypothetical protein